MALRSRVRLSLGSKILALKYKERLRLAGKRLTKRLLLPSKKLTKRLLLAGKRLTKRLLAVKVLLMTETTMTTKKLLIIVE